MNDPIVLVDSSRGAWGVGYGAESLFGMAHTVDLATGQPVVDQDAVAPLEALNWRLHQLGGARPDGTTDRRWSMQVVVDPTVLDPPRGPEDSPLQGDNYSALNRSTREVDAEGRSTIPSTLRRIVDAHVGGHSLALVIGNVPALHVLPPDARDVEDFSAYAALQRGTDDFGGSIVDLDATVTRSDSRDELGGYVWTQRAGGRVGLLQTVFAPELAAGTLRLGSEDTPIGRLPIRYDAQFGMPAMGGSTHLVGPVAFEPAKAPPRRGSPFSGALQFEPGLDPARDRTGVWRPVVFVDTDLPPGEAPEPLGGGAVQPPPPFGGIPPAGGLGGSGPGAGAGSGPGPGGGGSGSGGGGDGDGEGGSGGGKPKPPKPPKPMEYLGPLGPIDTLFWPPEGGVYFGPYLGPVSASGPDPFAPVGLGGGGPLLGAGLTVSPAPGGGTLVTGPSADLFPPSAGPRADNTRSPGLASGGWHPPTAPTLESPFVEDALAAKFGGGPLVAAGDPPLTSACGPTPDARPVPPIQETHGSLNGGVVSIGGHPGVSQSGGRLVVNAEDYAFTLGSSGPDYPAGRHNVFTATAPFLQAGGNLSTLTDHVRYTDVMLEAYRQVMLGLLGGVGSYGGTLSVLSRNTPSQGPSARNLIGEFLTAGADKTLDATGAGAVEIRSILEAPAGAAVAAPAGAVAMFVREQRGQGLIQDQRPLILLDNDRGARGRVSADLLATPDRSVAITGAGVGMLAGVYGLGTNPQQTVLATGYRAGLGGLQGLPTMSVTAGGVFTLTTPSDTPDAPANAGDVVLYNNAGTLTVLESDGTSTALGAGGGGVSSIEDLDNVNAAAAGPSDGSVLQFVTSSGEWTPTLSPTFSSLEITGKLTVGGLIDPTGLQLTPQASSPAVDTIWVDSADDRLKFTWDGFGVRDVAFSDEVASDPTTTRGDMIYRNASGNLARLGRGNIDGNQVLASQVDPIWIYPSFNYSAFGFTSGFNGQAAEQQFAAPASGTGQTYTLPTSSGTLALTSDLGGGHTVTDANTSSQVELVELVHDLSSGVPAAGFGGYLAIKSGSTPIGEFGCEFSGGTVNCDLTWGVYLNSTSVSERMRYAGGERALRIFDSLDIREHTSAPAAPSQYQSADAGRFAVYQDRPHFRHSNGSGLTGWKDGAALAADQGTAKGDLLYRNVAGEWLEALAIGTTGQVLTVSSGGVPEWAAASGGGSGDLLADGTVPLTADWDVGAFTITALRFVSDQATGTAPFSVSSTTTVSNLSADLLDGQEGTYYLTRSNHTGTLALDQGGTGATTDSGARTALGLEIGTDVQAYSARLADFAGLTFAKGDVFSFDGANVVKLGVGSNGQILYANSATSSGLEWAAAPAGGDLLADGSVPLTANWDVGAFTLTALRFVSDQATGTAPFTVASTTTVTNLSADLLDGEEGAYYLDLGNATGTLAVSNGGTGSTTAAGARTALGLAIGTDVQAYNALLADVAGLTLSKGDVLAYDGANLTRLAVGSNGQLLYANSATATGLEWAAAPSGGSGDLLADGSVPLTANWDVGAFTITGLRFVSDVTTGTAPFTVASTTLVSNLNADLLDSQEGSYYLTRSNHTGTLALDQGGTGATTAAGARTALGLVIGTDVQAYDAQLGDFAGLTFAKGDVFTYNGTNVVKLAVGTDGQVLKANSATSSGLEWGTGSSTTTYDDGASGLTIQNTSDATKQVQFDLSGLGTADTVTLGFNSNLIDNGAWTVALEENLPFSFTDLPENHLGISGQGCRMGLSTGPYATGSTSSIVLYATHSPWVAMPDGIGGEWRLYHNDQPSMSVAAYSDGVYDIFITVSSGAVGLHSTAWTNDTTRATGLEDSGGDPITSRDQTAFVVESGDEDDVYVATVKVESGTVSNQIGKRHIWNMFNRSHYVDRQVYSSTSHTMTSNTWRAMAANTTAGAGFRHEYVVGFGGAEPIYAHGSCFSRSNTSGAANVYIVGVQLDGTGAPTGDTVTCHWHGANTKGDDDQDGYERWVEEPAIGAHYLQVVEAIQNTVGTGYTIYHNDGGSPAKYLSSFVVEGWW